MTTKTKERAHVRALRGMDACADAVEFARGYPTLQAAWNACERGDWMLWLLAHTGCKDQRGLVRVAAACARRSLFYIKAGEERPRLAIEAAERWADDPSKANRAAARTAANAANAAAAAAAAANAADAAYAADAAAAAADAAAAAAAAANAAAAGRASERKAQADITRQHLPKAPKVAR